MKYIYGLSPTCSGICCFVTEKLYKFLKGVQITGLGCVWQPLRVSLVFKSLPCFRCGTSCLDSWGLIYPSRRGGKGDTFIYESAFIWDAERERNIDIFHLLVHSPNPMARSACARLKLGAHLAWVSTWVSGPQVIESSPATSRMLSAGSWFGEWSWDTNQVLW